MINLIDNGEYFTLVEATKQTDFRKKHVYMEVENSNTVNLRLNDGRFPGQTVIMFTRQDIQGTPYPDDATFISAMKDIIMVEPSGGGTTPSVPDPLLFATDNVGNLSLTAPEEKEIPLGNDIRFIDTSVFSFVNDGKEIVVGKSTTYIISASISVDIETYGDAAPYARVQISTDGGTLDGVLSTSIPDTGPVADVIDKTSYGKLGKGKTIKQFLVESYRGDI